MLGQVVTYLSNQLARLWGLHRSKNYAKFRLKLASGIVKGDNYYASQL